MPTVEWALSCDYAFYDQNRKICMIGVFDRIWGDRFPVTHPLFFVVSQWSGEPGETFNERTRIVGPDGSQVSQTHGISITISRAGGAGIRSSFTTISFREPGDYHIEFLADDNVIESIPLTLALAKEPSHQGS